MGLSRLSKRCRECKYVSTCKHKRMEALGYIAKTSVNSGALVSESVIQPHDYRDIKISADVTVTIDLEEMKKKITESMYPNFLQYVDENRYPRSK